MATSQPSEGRPSTLHVGLQMMDRQTVIHDTPANGKVKFNLFAIPRKVQITQLKEGARNLNWKEIKMQVIC